MDNYKAHCWQSRCDMSLHNHQLSDLSVWSLPVQCHSACATGSAKQLKATLFPVQTFAAIHSLFQYGFAYAVTVTYDTTQLTGFRQVQPEATTQKLPETDRILDQYKLDINPNG